MYSTFNIPYHFKVSFTILNLEYDNILRNHLFIEFLRNHKIYMKFISILHSFYLYSFACYSTRNPQFFVCFINPYFADLSIYVNDISLIYISYSYSKKF